ncbi:hypothetical protein GCK32_008840 [Trichostrongylus colubriformis]|uniref:Neurotransmitter-gated ion-channel ligand-binding domain-containing protein n=1 Tax=Trichostrongylus colubriformis TaxID=6319 RepID=A0AAN8FWT0_TRICO
MKDDDTRRLLNAKLTTDHERRAALIELLYPTIYKFSCLLDLRFFPFDVQNCTMIFSSWTYDQTGIDYFPASDEISIANYLENEGWELMTTKVSRHEVKYSCCPNAYTLLHLTLYLRRKPLFYLVNLIIPTSIITLIAIVGFFTTSSASGMREEKVSLGITTLLSMSILMLMVSDQMPTTSTFIPLIGWFILAMIIVISLGTVVSSIIIAVQKRGSHGERLSKQTLRIAKTIAYFTCTALPSHIEKEQMMEAFDAATPTVETVKPLKSAMDASKKWMSFKRAKNGVAVVSDKSTDALIHMANTGTEDAALTGMTPAAPPPPPPPPTAVLDDDLSLHSDLSTVLQSGRLNKTKSSARCNVFKDLTTSIRHNRQLAVAEFEWLATVLERTCFVIFVLCFLIITVGINFDEPAQNIKLNVWMIQKWKDEYLTWDPREYGMINSTIIPFRYLWIPDTYLYNSVKMSRDETERYMNIQVESQHWKGENGSQLSFLYPAIYTITCRLNIRFFPYDRQNCTLTISSWTNSMSALDYYADPEVNLASFIPNEEWDVKSFKIFRHEYKYACCAEPWAILQASLVIQRKPLYYIVNLIIPTSIITIVSITGFFTPASTDDDRTEKINLGTNSQLRRTSAVFSKEVDAMRRKRQCSLEWEFLAAVLDRLLLLLFIAAVVLITMGLVVVGKMAQFSYDHPDEAFF